MNFCSSPPTPETRSFSASHMEQETLIFIMRDGFPAIISPHGFPKKIDSRGARYDSRKAEVEERPVLDLIEDAAAGVDGAR